MKRREHQAIRLKQLTVQLDPAQPIHSIKRPVGGWLKAVRESLGLSLKSVAKPLHVSPQAIHQFEKAEATGAISLRQLEAVAGAMQCRVVYMIVPLHGTLDQLARQKDDELLRGVHHTMALENQAVDQTRPPS